MELSSNTISAISPDELLNRNIYSPADNIEGYKTNVPFLSRVVGAMVRSCFQYKNMLNSISEMPFSFGPLSYTAAMQKEIVELMVTSHIRRHSRLSTQMGKNPDIFVEHDEWIEKTYAQLLQDFSGEFITNGKFNIERARYIATSVEGQAYLKNKVMEFRNLEICYYSLGLTALKAMKEVLTSILIAITEVEPQNNELPFMQKDRDGSAAITFETYLNEIRLRIENLFNNNAFHIRSFSERITKGEIGFSPYEIIKDSQLGQVTLRHYLSDKNRHYLSDKKVKKNNKILYLASPLINMPEIYDLAKGKSVIEPLLDQGYEIYIVDHGNPGPEHTDLGLDFYAKTVHDTYLAIIKKNHPGSEIFAMGYCMGGTLLMPYLARRAEERIAAGKEMDIKKVALVVSPVKFDDQSSGHGAMRQVIRKDYDNYLMGEMYGAVNIPPQIIEVGMNEIQPGVRYYVRSGFYSRAIVPGAIHDAAPFFYWLTHGTKFASQAHADWIKKMFVENQLFNNKFTLASSNPELDGQPVDMDILKKAGVAIFDYRGQRDPISPSGSCLSSELWGEKNKSNVSNTKGGLNRTIEKNVGHIFVVSKKLLSEFNDSLTEFLNS